ncbi:PD-(D/E)XK nuclease family protein [archaeon]|nr:PD-(D/E)XK nuclease family protein [archaeon]
MVYTLSPASLSVFMECPRCFWLYQNEKVRRPQSTFNPSLPSGMDYFIKIYFDSYRKRGETPPELASLKGVELFDDAALLKTWRDNSNGIRWEDKNGNTLMGAVDDIVRNEEKLIVLDYKTKGFKLKSDSHERYQHQLDIYTFLLQQNHYETEDFACLLFYSGPKEVKENGVVQFYTDLVKVEVSVDNARKLFEDAISVLESKIPNTKCEHCKNSSLKKLKKDHKQGENSS